MASLKPVKHCSWIGWLQEWHGNDQSMQYAHRFEDFGLDANLTSKLSTLYNNVDQVEWFVGLMIESPRLPNSFIAEVRRCQHQMVCRIRPHQFALPVPF